MTVREFIYLLPNPQAYSGLEINAVRRDNTAGDVSICLVFPDVYEIGMSHYGLKVLYHMLNHMDGVTAERCFLPSREAIEIFAAHHVPLFSLESKRYLKEFDLIGFSLLTEMTFTNVFQVLDLAGIPLRREDRDESHPLIAAGGISAINPEPLRDFIDIFAIGDGEALFPEITPVLRQVKSGALTRRQALERLDDIEGVYIPALSPLVQKGRFFIPQVRNGQKRKRTVQSFIPDGAAQDFLVPITTDVVFDRLIVEIARGCPQNCRFCQAKSYYAPYRVLSLEETLSQIQEGLKKTGFETFSLSSLSTGDYPWLEPLLRLMPHIIMPGVAVSFPSLRPSTISENLLSVISQFRRTGITIVPEAGSQRLRKVINKNVTDEEIFNAVDLALRFNWQKIKLYFMLGLPTETDEDIDAIIDLILAIRARAASAKRKIYLHASFSPFTPKPHTPLQWAGMEDSHSLIRKIRRIRDKLGQFRSIDLDFHSPQKSVVEAILARGDYRVGRLLLDAYHKGEILSAWDKDFHYPIWEKLLDDNPAYDEFLAPADVSEELPWSFFQVNYKPGYLEEEYSRALQAIETPSCRGQECSDCQGCLFGFKRREEIITPEQEKALETRLTQPKITEFKRVRLFYEKKGDLTFFSHLSMMHYVERLIRRSSVWFRCTEGFHPRMKMVTLPALPVFAESSHEAIEIYLDSRYSEAELLERLNHSAAKENFRFIGARFSDHLPVMTKDIRYIDFQLSHPALIQNPDFPEDLRAMLTENDHISRNDGGFTIRIDWSQNGQERFAAFMNRIDPEKKQTRFLKRLGVVYKSDL